MSRVITFSEFYPKYHPKAGEPTFFVEKVLLSMNYLHTLGLRYFLLNNPEVYGKYMHRALCSDDIIPKYHTIRRGNRWKVGDWFSPRIWSGKPYRSKQIQFAPDIQVKKVWKLVVRASTHSSWVCFSIGSYDETQWVHLMGTTETNRLALNDGLEPKDFKDWFRIPSMEKRQKQNDDIEISNWKDIIFSGQIICWNDKINY